MPGNDGKLTPAEKQKIASWLQTKSKGSQCPSCGANNWTIGDHLLSGIVHHGGGNLVIGGPTYPMAFLVCNTCAYTRHYMAVPMGVIPAGGGGNG